MINCGEEVTLSEGVMTSTYSNVLAGSGALGFSDAAAPRSPGDDSPLLDSSPVAYEAARDLSRFQVAPGYREQNLPERIEALRERAFLPFDEQGPEMRKQEIERKLCDTDTPPSDEERASLAEELAKIVKCQESVRRKLERMGEYAAESPIVQKANRMAALRAELDNTQQPPSDQRRGEIDAELARFQNERSGEALHAPLGIGDPDYAARVKRVNQRLEEEAHVVPVAMANDDEVRACQASWDNAIDGKIRMEELRRTDAYYYQQIQALKEGLQALEAKQAQLQAKGSWVVRRDRGRTQTNVEQARRQLLELQRARGDLGYSWPRESAAIDFANRAVDDWRGARQPFVNRINRIRGVQEVNNASVTPRVVDYAGPRNSQYSEAAVADHAADVSPDPLSTIAEVPSKSAMESYAAWTDPENRAEILADIARDFYRGDPDLKNIDPSRFLPFEVFETSHFLPMEAIDGEITVDELRCLAIGYAVAVDLARELGSPALEDEIVLVTIAFGRGVAAQIRKIYLANKDNADNTAWEIINILEDSDMFLGQLQRRLMDRKGDGKHTEQDPLLADLSPAYTLIAIAAMETSLEELRNDSQLNKLQESGRSPMDGILNTIYDRLSIRFDARTMERARTEDGVTVELESPLYERMTRASDFQSRSWLNKLWARLADDRFRRALRNSKE